MSIEYRTYETENGEVYLVRKDSEAEADFLQDNTNARVVALDQATDDAGLVPVLPESIDEPTDRPSFREIFTGRMYCETDLRWVTPHDDNYGSNLQNFNENCGTGALPLIEWEHLGKTVAEGEILKNIHMIGRSNNAQVVDMQFHVVFKSNGALNNLNVDGINNDSQQSVVVLFSGLIKPVGQVAMNRIRSFTLSLNSFVVPKNGMIAVYARPVGLLTARRYFNVDATLESL